MRKGEFSAITCSARRWCQAALRSQAHAPMRGLPRAEATASIIRGSTRTGGASKALLLLATAAHRAPSPSATAASSARALQRESEAPTQENTRKAMAATGCGVRQQGEIGRQIGVAA